MQECFRYAKGSRKPICVAWLDLANAFGSVSHSLVQFALSWFHVPYCLRKLLHQYYESVFSFVEGSGWTSDWFWVSVGVLQGCTVSPTLFDLAFQLILNIHSAQANGLGFDFKKANQLVLKPTYADDVGLYSNHPQQNQKSMDIFLDALNWSGCFVLRVNKCRSFAAMWFTVEECSFTPNMKKR